MKISRRGSLADHGASEVVLGTPEAVCDGEVVHLRAKGARDFNTSANHDYDVSLSIEDIRNLVRALSKAALASPTAWERHLDPIGKDLVRLAATSMGLCSDRSAA